MGYLIATMIGAVIGLIMRSMCVVAKRSDKDIEQYEREKENNQQ